MEQTKGNRTYVGGQGRGRGRGREKKLEEKASNGPMWYHGGIERQEGKKSKADASLHKGDGSSARGIASERESESCDNGNKQHICVKEDEKKQQDFQQSNSRLEQMKKQREIAARFAESVEDEALIDKELQDEEILKSTFFTYQQLTQGEESSFSSQHLIDLLQDGATTCIICYETVKHEDAIWSCVQCFCIFHIQCIQKWCKEGLAVKNLYNEDVNTEKVIWCCPKCRKDYNRSECPEVYKCFCGKEHDPKFNPWCVPHSCGQQCGKRLDPDCGHDCLLLCHPGPCPPCPKMITAKCYCGQAKPMVKRCSIKEWSCGGICNQLLTCGHHLCSSYCHKGECLPCPKKSQQFCLCGKSRDLRECAEPFWQCQEACGKTLPCGYHVCEKICHAGECGECPRSGIRTCPCGKTRLSLPCTEDTPTCEDTCNKVLACKRHNCIRKCHFGACETCRQVLVKSCRCGKREKEVPCCTEYTCDFKCTNVRACGRHGCKRKCCDGNCPPCEQICNRTLNCKNHRCPAQCHQGPCYPCPLKKEVKCFCGKAVLTVACGKEKSIRPPKCQRQCMIPPSCHHESRLFHRCHYGPCPVCRQACSRPYDGCPHFCTEQCHDHIPAGDKKIKSALPKAPNRVEEEIFIPMPCPPCQTLVPRSCNGKHETIQVPCALDKAYSCSRECGRMLACGNHRCSRECHVVKEAEDETQAGRNCRKCNEFCQKPRAEGCIHDCKLRCHPGPCPDCQVSVRKQCHCGLMMLYLKCNELTSAQDVSAILSCKSQCSKLLVCGHQCSSVCHTGQCVNSNDCEQKVKVHCACRRKKREFPCSMVQRGEASLECDEKCLELKAKQEKSDSKKEEAKREAELKKQQEELDWFERKMQGRRRKQRKPREEEASLSFFEVHKWMFVGCVVFIIIASLLAFILPSVM